MLLPFLSEEKGAGKAGKAGKASTTIYHFQLPRGAAGVLEHDPVQKGRVHRAVRTRPSLEWEGSPRPSPSLGHVLSNGPLSRTAPVTLPG